MPDEREGYVRPATPDELASWNASSIKGTNPNAVNDEFSISSEQTSWEYTRWHRTKHRNSFDPQCKLCVIDQRIKQQKGVMPPCRACGAAHEAHIGGECPKT